MPTLESTPDCVFVEDAVVVANGKAFITRPGRDEGLTMAEELLTRKKKYRGGSSDATSL